ncbi:hypothetical protein [Thioclava sp. DLFJ5-1]|uniref:hypothetical protein n=1 Tax=Thioclava sp. DLFJ5-1 TaxID=1915314 RepID=UPI00143B84C4|nr:hypothetical protein [Thioclava sp. DLFJ5-1]
MNTVPATRHGSSDELKPSIVLRTEWHIANDVSVPLDTNDSHYHGGTPFDEVAALVALLLDVRVVAGPVDREFGLDDDPLGRPRAHDASHQPMLPALRKPPQIPRLNRTCHLNDLGNLGTYPMLPAAAATALVKAARLYQNALWIADTSPETSWLLLVAAVETAANHWDGDVRTDVERLRFSFEPMVRYLEERGAEEHVPEIAKYLSGVIGATSKFTTFMVEFSPKEPPSRPTWEKLDFEPRKLKNAFRAIYQFRSRALHAGIPFPMPMCDPPRSSSNGIHVEKPMGIATGTLNASWRAEDTPMLLHMFAYLTQGALMNWWSSMTSEIADVS